ncbi:MAG: lysophospholipase [Bacteroidales bacterium]|nr:lysophospholipase [Bacteroidales bacterium]
MDIKITIPDFGELHGIHMPAGEPRACIILVHGLGEHTGRYTALAEFFNSHGYSFTGLDLPGHGKSPGKRGHIRSFRQYNDIIDSMVEYIRQKEGGLPLVLYGHSLGGTIALNYLLENNHMSAGLISAPWIKLSFEPPRIKMLLASLVSKIMPSLVQASGLNPEHISTDKEVVERYKADPLVHSSISAGLFVSAMVTAERLLEGKNKLEKPVLLVHSEADMITSIKGSAIFAENNHMAELKRWEKGYHELHNEAFGSEVLAYFINWLREQNGI